MKPSAAGAFCVEVVGVRVTGATCAAAIASSAGTARAANAGTWCLWIVFMGGSRRLKQPALFLALGIELRQRRETAPHGRKNERFFGIGYRLGHHAPRAVGKLVHAPKLFGSACEGRQHD